jgi:hypothetical protein
MGKTMATCTTALELARFACKEPTLLCTLWALRTSENPIKYKSQGETTLLWNFFCNFAAVLLNYSYYETTNANYRCHTALIGHGAGTEQ